MELDELLRRSDVVALLGAYAVAEAERYVSGLPLLGAVREDDLARIA